MKQKTPSSCCHGLFDEQIFDCKAEVLSLPSGKLSAELDRNNGENSISYSHGRLNTNGNPNLIASNHTWNWSGHPDCGNTVSSIANPSPENPNPKCTQKSPAHSSINRSKMANPIDAQRILPAPFLSKTYQLVDDPASDEVVSWNKNGSTFVVWQPAEFAKEILPNYFKHNNFSSFVRQLNTYGFRKIVPDRWEFAHDCFRKGEKCLLIDIHRRKAAVLPSKPSTSPHKQFMSPTNSASEQAASSSSSPLSSPPDKSAPRYHRDEALKLKQENMLLVSELSCLRRLCSDLLLYVQRHIKGSSEFTSPIATLLQSKSLLEDTAAYKSFRERSSPDCDNLDDTKEEGAGCEFFSSSSGDDGGENLELRLVLPQARCKESYTYKGTATIKRIRDQDRSPPRLFGVELPCQKRISLGSSRHSDYQEKP